MLFQLNPLTILFFLVSAAVPILVLLLAWPQRSSHSKLTLPFWRRPPRSEVPMILPQRGGQDLTYPGDLIHSPTEQLMAVFLVLMTMAVFSGCAAGKINEPTQSLVRSPRER